MRRLAIDLELHRVPSVMPTDERGQREVLNRLRTHIICYVIDRCFCINLGKPFMIPEDDVRAFHLPFYLTVDPDFIFSLRAVFLAYTQRGQRVPGVDVLSRI